MARYEGIIQVTGFMRVVVEEKGMTMKEARSQVEMWPESFKAGYVEGIEFSGWDESLEKTEDDEPEEEEGDNEEE